MYNHCHTMRLKKHSSNNKANYLTNGVIKNEISKTVTLLLLIISQLHCKNCLTVLAQNSIWVVLYMLNSSNTGSVDFIFRHFKTFSVNVFEIMVLKHFLFSFHLFYFQVEFSKIFNIFNSPVAPLRKIILSRKVLS